MSAPDFPAFPLFDAHREFVKLPLGLAMLDDYPDSRQFLARLKETIPGVNEDFISAQRFLKSYSRKSEKTFTSFRNEVERYLLWAWTVEGKAVSQLRRSHIENYFDFLHAPPTGWIGSGSVRRFEFIGGQGLFRSNPLWRPFVIREAARSTNDPRPDSKDAASSAKNDKKDKKDILQPEKKGYRLSNSATALAYSAISVFYDHLVQEDIVLGNPIPGIRKASPYLIKDAQVKQIKRLSELQWEYVLETLKEKAEEQPSYERTIFIIACLKSLYLRISELSDRPKWTPMWEHVWKDHDGNWWFKAFGKGLKIRDVSVSSAMWEYIRRYREHRGLTASPSPGDKEPLLQKMRGGGGLTSRQIARLVREAFELAYHRMMKDGFENDAKELRKATTHWLRHTGASQDIANRPLKHMADDLGHASMGTTDRVYIQSDMKERAATGRSRKV
ncbi:tyrosine-type recombinase/integrase [Hahella sp. NBU794]|uniref:tyrosine-type recombinase/integrase n=1 Tax=Hahella sp. NBU794 TaxID=3422590 RepID=UPI003D6FE6C6